MSRSPNFAYQSPIADIGSSLVRAVLGDPQMAARQREQQAIADERAAQAERARAHAGLYTSQTAGQDGQNAASHGLPDMVRQWVAANAPAPPAPTVSSPEFANFDQPIPEPAARPDRGESLANMVAAMAQMNGEHVDPTKIVGSLASFLGGDELARRGLIAQGHSPTADFAVTPERADQVAGIKNDALEHRALGVANIGAGARRYAADSSAGASRYSADSRARTSNFATSTRAATSRYATDAKSAGPAPGFDVIQSVFPGATMNSGFRTEAENRRVDGVPNSNHLGNRPGVMAYDLPVQPGMTVEEGARAIEAAHPNVRVIEARDETGRHGPTGKPLGGWHYALQNIGGPAPSGRGGRAAPAAKPPKAITQKQLDMIDAELKTQIEARHVQFGDPRARAILRAGIISNFQGSGNPADAVNAGITRMQASANASAARRRAAPAAPGDGAIVDVTTLAQAHALPPNSLYRTPNGRVMRSPAAAPGSPRLSPQEASRLPKGSRFTGQDGVERTRL